MDDDARFALYGKELATTVRAALPQWVDGAVASRLPKPWSEELTEQVAVAGNQVAESIGNQLDELVALDIDEQWTNPLSIIRTATAAPTTILADAGVPEARRDDHARAIEPADVYDLTPAAFADLGPEAHSLGIQWGAAKAHLHLRRRAPNPQNPTISAEGTSDCP